jgi:tRNA dimethylallyltransferase
MNKLLVVCGPTAIGKTSVGIKLGKKYSGEIISADSRQVYKGMDIGTGKDIENSSIYNLQFTINKYDVGFYEINDVPVWLMDMAEPDQQVTVADWLKGAKKVVQDLQDKNKLPIIVGGTGFYIQAFTDGIDTLGIPPDKKQRKKLNKLPVDELQQKLEKAAPKVYQNLNRSDRNNPHRLIRKIEIAQAKESKDFDDSNHRSLLKAGADVLKIGLRAPKKYIYEKIDQRVEKRIEQGLLEEIEELLGNGYTWDDPGMNTLAYKEFRSYFKDGKNIEDFIQRWKYDEHSYARRQLTWFKKDKKIKWFDITDENRFDDLEKLVHNWYIEDNG